MGVPLRQFKLNVTFGSKNLPTQYNAVFGQNGLNPSELNKRYLAKTNNLAILPGTLITLLLDVYPNKVFELTVLRPTLSYLIKKEIKVLPEKNLEIKGVLSLHSLYKIARIRAVNKEDTYNMCLMIIGTCKSMGIKIINN